MMKKIWKATLLAMVAVGFITTVRSKKQPKKEELAVAA